ncbi:hypothetical protein BDD12DRAFT_808051 [Trichophaea hybrida]|nr:hypothetical protein BDD12DRAFT_808051 [Trichophaea hybrida]
MHNGLANTFIQLQISKRSANCVFRAHANASTAQNCYQEKVYRSGHLSKSFPVCMACDSVAPLNRGGVIFWHRIDRYSAGNLTIGICSVFNYAYSICTPETVLVEAQITEVSQANRLFGSPDSSAFMPRSRKVYDNFNVFSRLGVMPKKVHIDFAVWIDYDLGDTALI